MNQTKEKQIDRVRVLWIALIYGLLILSPLGRMYCAFASSPLESALVWKPTFPRLFFPHEKIENLKERVSRDEETRAAWLFLLERADQLLGDTLVSLEYAESGQGQHGNYGRPSQQMSQMGATLGLAYQMTGDEKYAEKLRLAMLHFSRLKRWAGDAHHDPPWHSELNTARFCFGYAIGYDSIHDYLNESDREEIVNAIVRLGILPTLQDWILPEQRIHALDSMGHNWWSVCVAMAGAASLSILDDHPDAERWVELVRDSFTEWFAYQGNVLQNKSPNFDRHGAFYESVNYANYALSEFLLFRLAYTNIFPNSTMPDIPILENAGDFFIHTAYPTSDSILTVNFGDSSLRSTGAKTLQLLKDNGFDKPAYSWYLTRTDWGLRDPIGLVYQDVQVCNEAPETLANSTIYPDIGWCMMRSSWKNDATMLAIKSGFSWNHAHPDAGSFILFHNGKPLLIDSGNCSYSRREYTSYYRHSKAHNVILFDGEGQNPEDVGHGDRGVVQPGRILHRMDSAGIKYALADNTGPTAWKCSRNYRHFLWIDDVILIVDDIRTHEPAQMEGLCSSILDAQYFGIPIIATNVGGIPEIVHHEENGLLIPPNDPDALAQAVQRLLTAPDQRRVFGQAGKEMVLRSFTMEAVGGGEVLGVYEKLYGGEG